MKITRLAATALVVSAVTASSASAMAVRDVPSAPVQHPSTAAPAHIDYSGVQAAHQANSMREMTRATELPVTSLTQAPAATSGVDWIVPLLVGFGVALALFSMALLSHHVDVHRRRPGVAA
jgi:hypothetical protein